MLAYTFVEQGRFELREKPRPELQAGRYRTGDVGKHLYQ